ncbi:hypothetical protein IWW34DRAFT_902378 [Fusarium oxysporum f. sp. albedinis]|nr:hypothetical protein IWW34DRAFT_902378 [Fusarium oxysporum f. sp. albedinis]
MWSDLRHRWLKSCAAEYAEREDKQHKDRHICGWKVGGSRRPGSRRENPAEDENGIRQSQKRRKKFAQLKKHLRRTRPGPLLHLATQFVRKFIPGTADPIQRIKEVFFEFRNEARLFGRLPNDGFNIFAGKTNSSEMLV